MHVLVISHIQFGVQLSLSVTLFFRQTLLSDGAGSSSVLQNIYIIQSVIGIVGYCEDILQ
jgi:hypothetical protein